MKKVQVRFHQCIKHSEKTSFGDFIYYNIKFKK